MRLDCAEMGQSTLRRHPRGLALMVLLLNNELPTLDERAQLGFCDSRAS